MALPHNLLDVLSAIPKMALAYSGGLDSRFLSHCARLCGIDVLLLHAVGPHIPRVETAHAREWAHANGLPLVELPFDPFQFSELRHNRHNRCLVCKKNLFSALKAQMKDETWILCDGSQKDDEKAHRPGRLALKEAGVISPLAKAGLSKAVIRELAAATGMSNPDQAARPCLFTRINYDLYVTPRILAQVEACEQELGEVLAGKDFRLRLCPEPMLQVAGKIPQEAAAILQKCGFANGKLVECDCVSGFFDNFGA